jgi:hypothetical protein
MRPFERWCCVGVMIAYLAGCKPPAQGAITPEGYQHNAYAYGVLPNAKGQLMAPPWKIDNFYIPPGAKSLQPKNSDEYVLEYQLDLEGDGEFETRVDELTYDLRFEHLEHDGVIFLRTIPLSSDMKQKKLSVLMERYVEAIAGAGYEVVALNASSTMVLERRYAAVVIERGAARLAGLDAYIVTLDVANTEHLKVDPNARKQRVQLVLLHTPFKYHPRYAEQAETSFPVAMFIGYANQPEEYDAGLPAFHDFLRRIVIGERAGLALGTSDKADALVPASSASSTASPTAHSAPDATPAAAPPPLPTR